MKKDKRITLYFKEENYNLYYILKEKLNKLEKETGKSISFSGYIISLIKKDL